MQPRSVDGALGNDGQGNTFIIRNGVPVKAAQDANGAWAPDIGVKNPAAPGAGMWNAPASSAPDPIARRAEYTAQNKQLNDERAALGNYQSMGQDLDTFDHLNQQRGTGGFFNAVPGFKGINEINSPNLQQMSQIGSKLQVASVVKGQGSISDFERKLFAQGVPTTDKYGGVNSNITAYMRSKLAEENDRLDFQEHYLSSNGTTAGSQRAWSAYTQANPYIANSPTANDSYPATGKAALISNRQPWQSYFGLAHPAQGAAPPVMAPRAAPAAAHAAPGGGWSATRTN